MKKRLFSVAAVAMALTMALAGCSSSEEKTEEGAEQTEQTEGGEDNVLTVAKMCIRDSQQKIISETVVLK